MLKRTGWRQRLYRFLITSTSSRLYYNAHTAVESRWRYRSVINERVRVVESIDSAARVCVCMCVCV